jgi:hypothetical protein
MKIYQADDVVFGAQMISGSDRKTIRIQGATARGRGASKQSMP